MSLADTGIDDEQDARRLARYGVGHRGREQRIRACEHVAGEVHPILERDVELLLEDVHLAICELVNCGALGELGTNPPNSPTHQFTNSFYVTANVRASHPASSAVTRTAAP